MSGFGAEGQVIPHPSVSGSNLGVCGKDNTADADQDAVGVMWLLAESLSMYSSEERGNREQRPLFKIIHY